MQIPILSVYDQNGNQIPIPAIKGKDGKMPQKGVDYFTEDGKAEIVQAVLSALPNASGVSF